jgi:tripartite-type tricarboxylate transporter receptor subunit TctC
LALEPTVKANPDGHTLLSYGTSVFLSQIMQHGKLLYDPFNDLTPITLTATSPLVLVVTPSLPVKSVAELIAYAKAHPGKLNHSSANPGSSSHLTPELFKRVAGVSMVSIPYKSGSQELVDLIAGRVQVAFINPGQASGAMKEGKLRTLAVTSAEPSALVPGLPTVASQGLPGFFDMSSKYGLFGPAKTPAAIVKRINHEVVLHFAKPKVRELLLLQGVEPVGNSPEAFAAAVKAELSTRTKLVAELGLIPALKE